MPPAAELLFEVLTPLAFRARVTRKRWEMIATIKHPVTAGREADVRCEETGEEVVLMKDASGRVIGFEKLNFSVPKSEFFRVAFETAPA